MKIAYVRVSTADQNEARQIEALKPYGIERWYTEKISASTTKRPQLQAMLQFVREGDVVYIHDFSRLARNTSDLLMIVEDLRHRGITLVSSKENLDTGTATGKLMLTVIAAINEFEREILLERQREGIAVAKQKMHTKAEVQSSGRWILTSSTGNTISANSQKRIGQRKSVSLGLLWIGLYLSMKQNVNNCAICGTIYRNKRVDIFRTMCYNIGGEILSLVWESLIPVKSRWTLPLSGSSKSSGPYCEWEF